MLRSDVSERTAWRAARLSRRRLLRGAALGTGGLGGLILLACGSEDKEEAATPAGASPVAAAPGTLSPDTPKPGGMLRLSSTREPTTLDPVVNGNYGAEIALNLPIYDRLFDYDPDLNLLTGEGLVAAFEHPDPLSYTFKLHHGISFHDGTPLTAQAVAAHLDRAKKDPNSVAKGDVAPLASWETPDQSTIVLKLSRGAGEFPVTLAGRGGAVVSPAAVEKYGKEVGRNPSGTGPFKLDEWTAGTKWSLVKNSAYWKKGVPHLERISYTVIVDEQAVSTALRSREVDASSGQGALATQYAVLKGADNLTILERPGFQFYMFYMNGTKPPFNNPALAQAVSYALNREELIGVASFGHGTVVQGFIPNGHPFFDPNFQPFPPKGDEKMAKQKLAEGGMPNGFEFVIDTYDTGAYPRLSQAIQAQLQKVGIRTTIRQQDSPTGTQRILSLDMDTVLSQWSGRASLFETVSQLYHSTGAYQAKGRSANPRFDELAEKAGNALDANEAKKHYQELQRLVAEDGRNPAFGALNVIGYHQKPVRNYVLNTDAGTRLTNVWMDR